MSLRLTGALSGIGSALAGPETLTVPLSAPPSFTSMEGLSAPAGRAMGAAIAPLAVLTVRS